LKNTGGGRAGGSPARRREAGLAPARCRDAPRRQEAGLAPCAAGSQPGPSTPPGGRAPPEAGLPPRAKATAPCGLPEERRIRGHSIEIRRCGVRGGGYLIRTVVAAEKFSTG